MPVSKSLSRKQVNANREYASRHNVGTSRRAEPFLPNVAGKRYVRDESKPGIVAKMIDR